ncbi:hypothetical protein E2562_000111 [Oryza meyeriana var. granulata]|uniref:Uncharacterized protein n=1 Tax=Oryza meyeriana var. granulata TaxID=110450 RepID=A0A6G1DBJ0_9ORYZ|nr:hypothetical protein E2562_000111 [Oryza meyeriana var. granulata]
MKASLKLREDGAAPLLRAKLPVALFSVPTVVSLTAGDPADLRLSLATAAPALPSLRVSYVNTAGAVSFSLVLKPSLGDFAVRKRFDSAGRGAGSAPTTTAAAAASASEVTMRSAIPLRGGEAAVSVRWGVRIPAEVTTGGEEGAAALALRRLPFLVLGKLAQHVALEVIEAKVEEPERRQAEHDVGEQTHEAVVAKVELVEEPEAAERGREHAAEAVGVEMEQREIGEQAELRREVPRDVAVVEVHPDDGDHPSVPRQRRAEYAGVVANLGPHPVGGEVLGVGEDGLLLPRLQRHVRIPQPGAQEPLPWVHRHCLRPQPLAAVAIDGEIQRRRPAGDGGTDNEQ